VDMVVMNVTYPFFSAEILQTRVLFPKVYPDAFSPAERKELGLETAAPTVAGGEAEGAGQTGTDGREEAAAAGKVGIADNPVWETGPEELLTNRLMAWKLYKYRQEINRFLFGDSPAKSGKRLLDRLLDTGLAAPEKVETPAGEGLPGTDGESDVAADGAAEGQLPRDQEAVGQEPAGQPENDSPDLAAKDRPENLYKVYDQFEWLEPEIEHLRKVFRVEPLDETNLGYRYLEKSVRLIREENLPAAFYLSPVNFTLLDRYAAVDRESWEKNSEKLTELFRLRDLPCYDLQETVDDQCFHDSLHLVDRGNREVAAILFGRLKPELLRLSGDLANDL
jgi:hypothetical protein